jgi:hydroxymethylpyrimidine/phosphomethylpyrimidine kinase
MIGSAATAHAVADVLQHLSVPIVFDPVMVATSGSVLADDETIAAFERLIRIATVTTPNLPEFEILSNAESVQKGAAMLRKGGHGEGATVVDRLLVDGVELRHWTNSRIDTQHSHGTGCTLASGIATGLARGLPLEEAIDRAIAFVRAALADAPGLGAGHGPMGHALGVIPFDEIKG